MPKPSEPSAIFIDCDCVKIAVSPNSYSLLSKRKIPIPKNIIILSYNCLETWLKLCDVRLQSDLCARSTMQDWPFFMLALNLLSNLLSNYTVYPKFYIKFQVIKMGLNVHICLHAHVRLCLVGYERERSSLVWRGGRRDRVRKKR